MHKINPSPKARKERGCRTAMEELTVGGRRPLQVLSSEVTKRELRRSRQRIANILITKVRWQCDNNNYQNFHNHDHIGHSGVSRCSGGI